MEQRLLCVVDARRENNSDKNALDFLRSIVGHRHTNFPHSNESARASFRDVPILRAIKVFVKSATRSSSVCVSASVSVCDNSRIAIHRLFFTVLCYTVLTILNFRPRYSIAPNLAFIDIVDKCQDSLKESSLEL